MNLISIPDLSQLESVTGFLLPDEARLLYQLASETPTGGVICEIGSYQGKSTIALGLGAQIAGAGVWAIDDHSGYQERSGTVFGMQNHAGLIRNLSAFHLGDTVRVVALASYHAVRGWYFPIDLLFIDGQHDYESVKRDFDQWSSFVRGKIALHDTAGDWPGVTQLVSEIIQAGVWERVRTVDTISVFERRVQS